MTIFLSMIVRVFVQIFSLLIIVDAVLSFMVSPYHPVREAMGRILNPIYAPLRKIIPPAGGFDFSPIILLFLVQIIGTILTRLLGGI